MSNTAQAFIWITDVLDQLDLKYKITGGFAARVYGVKRDLADIDIEVFERDIAIIAPAVMEYVIYGPKRYIDDSWDIELMTLRYLGQEIDIAAANSKIFNRITNQWESCISDLNDVNKIDVYGKVVPIENVDSLIDYKMRLGRDVDIEDVKQLSALLDSILNN